MYFQDYMNINIKNNFYLIWIDQITKAVWFQIFKEAASNYRSQNKYLLSVQEPSQLSKSIHGNFDSSFVISDKNFLYGICEINNTDYLFSLNLKKTKFSYLKIFKKLRSKNYFVNFNALGDRDKLLNKALLQFK